MATPQENQTLSGMQLKSTQILGKHLAFFVVPKTIRKQLHQLDREAVELVG
jgi:hypothetical protein